MITRWIMGFGHEVTSKSKAPWLSRWAIISAYFSSSSTPTTFRSEERRVGKECRCACRAYPDTRRGIRNGPVRPHRDRTSSQALRLPANAQENEIVVDG